MNYGFNEITKAVFMNAQNNHLGSWIIIRELIN